jgi:hypothetical protein
VRRVRDLLSAVVVVAIYLAAARTLFDDGADGTVSTWAGLASFLLLAVVLPFHFMIAWDRWIEPRNPL